MNPQLLSTTTYGSTPATLGVSSTASSSLSAVNLFDQPKFVLPTTATNPNLASNIQTKVVPTLASLNSAPNSSGNPNPAITPAPSYQGSGTPTVTPEAKPTYNSYTTPSGAVIKTDQFGQIVSETAPTTTTEKTQYDSTISSLMNTIKGYAQKVSDTITGRKSTSDVLNQAYTQFGVQDTLNKITALTPELTSLNEELNRLKTEEATLTENLYGQGRGIPLAILEGQAGKIQRQYAIRESSVAGQIAAKSSTIEALKGNLDLARTFAKDAVDALTYDEKQKVDDYKTLFEMNSDIISNLTTAQKNELDRQSKAAIEEYNNKQDAIKYATDQSMLYPLANILPTDSREEVARKVNTVYGGSIERQKEARISAETNNNNEVYVPNIPGLTKSQAVDVYNTTIAPEWFKAQKPGLSEKNLQIEWSKYKNQKIKGGSGEFLTPEFFKNLYTSDQLFNQATQAGYSKGFFGSKEGVVQDYLDSLTASITAYRNAGFTDEEILKMMQ